MACASYATSCEILTEESMEKPALFANYHLNILPSFM